MLNEAVRLSCEKGGSVESVRSATDVDVEVFFLRHLQAIPIHEEEYRGAKGRCGWLVVDGKGYVVATATIGGSVLVKTYPQAIPLHAIMSVRGAHDIARMKSGQLDWFEAFFKTVRNMTHTFADLDPDRGAASPDRPDSGES